MTAVSASETTGDIATVCDSGDASLSSPQLLLSIILVPGFVPLDAIDDCPSFAAPVGGGSDLRLWTVNGDLIGHVHCREIICSVAFSNQPEGVSVNVIAGGLENGVVRWAWPPTLDLPAL